MEPGGPMPHSQGLSSNPYPEPNRTDTYLFKVYLNIVLPKGLLLLVELTPWLMEPGGSMPHSQGLSSNPYPEPNHTDTYLF